MKRYLIEQLEPIQALELCKTVTCDYDKLLNINYDFVTQSFAPGNTSQEKFIYLASRVSKNINNDPEIIFVHFNGRPMGTKRFYQIDEADKDNEDIRHDREEVMNIITSGLFNTLAVEWYYQDEHNMWIKVNRPNDLPTTFEGPLKEFNGRQQQKILRGNDVYDYPSTRAEVMKIESGVEYPGVVNITNDVIKSMIYKITQLYYPKNQLNSVVVNDAAEDYILDWYASDITPGYNTYMMMKDEYTRSEAEAFSNAYYRDGTFSDNLMALYGYDVDQVL